ncbi:TauD/TfdA family dioxygenase [Micromonospora sp. HNM0581]|uniref:TauD/TfdA family dioxygenase n=1 Tax=Micromonospora sp. HNM0581 TaxID=2716341 RepID=UPI00146C8295|nr:TauD/TfdA family dioxygenase [Micromonospora sp. HNM0581]
MTVVGGVPLLTTRSAQSAHLGRALASIEIDDKALAEPAYQDAIVASVREAAGNAFDDLVEEVAKRLADPPWFTIVRGLPASRATPLLVAVSATLGLLVEPYRQPWSRVVRHIVPSRDRAVAGQVLNEFLHTDGTDWPQPNDYTCLFCVRPDQSQDGESRLLDVATLLEEATAGPNGRVVKRLAAQALPWRIADELGGGIHWEPAINLATLHIRWLRYTAALSHAEGLAPLPASCLDDMVAFEQLVENCKGVVRIHLQAGDLMLIDNGRCLHARTPIRNPAASTRELRRTKVMRKVETQ